MNKYLDIKELVTLFQANNVANSLDLHCNIYISAALNEFSWNGDDQDLIRSLVPKLKRQLTKFFKVRGLPLACYYIIENPITPKKYRIPGGPQRQPHIHMFVHVPYDMKNEFKEYWDDRLKPIVPYKVPTNPNRAGARSGFAHAFDIQHNNSPATTFLRLTYNMKGYGKTLVASDGEPVRNSAGYEIGIPSKSKGWQGPVPIKRCGVLGVIKPSAHEDYLRAKGLWPTCRKGRLGNWLAEKIKRGKFL